MMSEQDEEQEDIEYVSGEASIQIEGVGEIHGYAIREKGNRKTTIFSSVTIEVPRE